MREWLPVVLAFIAVVIMISVAICFWFYDRSPNDTGPSSFKAGRVDVEYGSSPTIPKAHPSQAWPLEPGSQPVSNKSGKNGIRVSAKEACSLSIVKGDDVASKLRQSAVASTSRPPDLKHVAVREFASLGRAGLQVYERATGSRPTRPSLMPPQNGEGSETFRNLRSSAETGDGWVKIENPETGLTYCFLRRGSQHVASRWEKTPPKTSKPIQSATSSPKNDSSTVPSDAATDIHITGDDDEIIRMKGEVFRQLRQTHTDDVASRRRLFKNLSVQWHPDKNLDCRDRAKDVFQFLQQQRGWYLRDTEHLP